MVHNKRCEPTFPYLARLAPTFNAWEIILVSRFVSEHHITRGGPQAELRLALARVEISELKQF